MPSPAATPSDPRNGKVLQGEMFNDWKPTHRLSLHTNEIPRSAAPPATEAQEQMLDAAESPGKSIWCHACRGRGKVEMPDSCIGPVCGNCNGTGRVSS